MKEQQGFFLHCGIAQPKGGKEEEEEVDQDIFPVLFSLGQKKRKSEEESKLRIDLRAWMCSSSRLGNGGFRLRQGPYFDRRSFPNKKKVFFLLLYCLCLPSSVSPPSGRIFAKLF